LRGAVPQLFDETNRQLQLAGRKLSKLRDAEALLEALDDLVEDRRAQALLTRRKQRINDSDQTGRDLRLAMTELRKTMRSLEKLTLHRLEFPVVAAAVERTISRGKHAYEQAYAEPSSERFHELRKRSKDLRYQLALLSPVWPEVLQGYSDTAKKLEQHLGEDHNLAVLIEVVPKLKDAATKKQASLRQKSEIIAGRLYAEPVKVWAARLRVAWGGFDNR
jgi:CHAD domain-containing protein